MPITKESISIGKDMTGLAYQWSRVACAMALAVVLLYPAAAMRYEPDVTASEWLVTASIFECRMSQGIPLYGDAVFFQKAGESQKFFLYSSSPQLKTGQASLTALRPEWKKQGPGRKDLGYVPVKQRKQAIVLDSKMTQRVLTELQQGMAVVFTRQAWYSPKAEPDRAREPSLEVGLSAVNFLPAYDRYLGCLADLLPVNFDQIERTAIYFGSAKEALPNSEVAKLDNIGIYVRADSSVNKFFVDGHTDSAGNRQENLELSRQRAEMVTRALVARGVPAESIVMRWHGERYPVASNQSAAGRAKNRRVTVRLVRGAKAGGEESEEFEGEGTGADEEQTAFHQPL